MAAQKVVHGTSCGAELAQVGDSQAKMQPPHPWGLTSGSAKIDLGVAVFSARSAGEKFRALSQRSVSIHALLHHPIIGQPAWRSGWGALKGVPWPIEWSAAYLSSVLNSPTQRQVLAARSPAA
eukprot:356460-Chlamydomonas_euryale.AAC.6